MALFWEPKRLYWATALALALLFPTYNTSMLGAAHAADIVAIGRAHAVKDVQVAAQVEGVVADVKADLGDPVAEGDVIVKVDDWSYVLDVAQAEANLALAEAEFSDAVDALKRAEELFSRNAGSEKARNTARTALAVAESNRAFREAALARVQRHLEDTAIAAPFSGHVATRHIEVGSFVRSGDAVATIVDISSIVVRFDLIERDYARLAVGAKGTIVFEALPDQSFSGTITRLGPSAKEGIDTFPVEIVLPNKPLTLKPGYTARITFPEEDVAIR